jgi:hypothetical protein
MKHQKLIEIFVWAGAFAAVAWSARAAADPESVSGIEPERGQRVSVYSQIPADSLQAMMHRIVAANPFGEEPPETGTTEPPAQMYQSVVGMRSVGVAATMPRLAGVAGPPWIAVFADQSGLSRTTVEVRDTVAGFRVLAISREGVLLRSRDTTIRLSPTAGRQ